MHNRADRNAMMQNLTNFVEYLTIRMHESEFVITVGISAMKDRCIAAVHVKSCSNGG